MCIIMKKGSDAEESFAERLDDYYEKHRYNASGEGYEGILNAYY